MKTITAVALSAFVALALGLSIGRHMAEVELYSSGYEAGIQDIQNEMAAR